MSKVALLVEFAPRTRVVIDVPDGITALDYLETNDGWDKVAEMAREQMLQESENYLSGENMVWDFDDECPFGSLSSDKEDGAE